MGMDCIVSKLARRGKIWDFDNGMSFDTGRVRLGICAKTCHIVQNPAKRSYFGALILPWCGQFDENPRFYDKISSLKTIDNTTRILTKKVVEWGFHRSFGLYRAVLIG